MPEQRTAAAEPKKKRSLHRITQKPRVNPGASPGALVPIACSTPATVRVLRVGDKAHPPKLLEDLTKLPEAAKQGACWVRVCGLGDLAPLLAITEFYGIRRLALEDILNTGWRTKLEEYGEYLFFVLQIPPIALSGERGGHLSLFCKPGLIITFEEAPTPLVDTLWERLQQEPPVSKLGQQAGFLAYLTLDMIIDRFFPVLDQKDEVLADLEEVLNLRTPGKKELHALHTVKRDLLTIRRLLTPYRELGAGLRQHRLAEAAEELRPFFSDLRDHIVQAEDLLDTYHEVANSLDSIYQSAMANRMNDIIKMLTIISTIFMPLSFIAGLYGMNFDPNSSPWNMPELRWAFGYPAVLALMGAVVGGMLWFFRKRRWL